MERGPVLRLDFLLLILLVLSPGARGDDLQSCEEVRKLFQLRHLGLVKGLPETPRAGILTVATAKIILFNDPLNNIKA
ncbi:glypican-5-like isoform X3 [Antechinus flavipes]|uniref:glypican-5-like isoform X2 n=1 Tax=Antechinus flavipes TaxID=38775 RepID=UPI002235752E|nr:glypican-5-like isoform X2 [Antechinus flavipes]XP_051839962.1 glypican-5-like isoform X3 [Antechinus flavipes]